MNHVSYLENSAIVAQLDAAPEYRKSAVTLLRLPAATEVGSNFPTYVKAADGMRIEASNTVAADHVVARNPGEIGSNDGTPVFNEWLIPRATAEKNYGDQIAGLTTTEFAPCKKSATLRALPLTQNMLDALGVPGPELFIKVSWSDRPMTAIVGDYLTSAGYSISQHDMASYEPVTNLAPSRPRLG